MKVKSTHYPYEHFLCVLGPKLVSGSGYNECVVMLIFYFYLLQYNIFSVFKLSNLLYIEKSAKSNLNLEATQVC